MLRWAVTGVRVVAVRLLIVGVLLIALLIVLALVCGRESEWAAPPLELAPISEWEAFSGTGYRAGHDPGWELIRYSPDGSPETQLLVTPEFADLWRRTVDSGWSRFAIDAAMETFFDDLDDPFRFIMATRVCRDGQTLQPGSADRYMRNVALQGPFEELPPVFVDGHRYVVFDFESAAATRVLDLAVPGPSGCWVRFRAGGEKGDPDIERAFRLFLSTVRDVE